MSMYFNVSDIEIRGFYAGDAMREVADGLKRDTLKTIEIVNSDMVINNGDNEEWAKTIFEMDAVVPGDLGLLNMSGVTDKKFEKEVSSSVFIKMFLKYMNNHMKKIFIIAMGEYDLLNAKERLKGYGEDNSIDGMSFDGLTGRSEEEIINVINAVEPDCILSVLPSPKQEQFIKSNKPYINAGIWLGCGEVFLNSQGGNVKRSLLRIFKKDKNKL